MSIFNILIIFSFFMFKFMFKKRSSGFTLVELSIILVILGLITGSIVGAGRLIQVARVNSILNEFNTIAKSIVTFSAVYGGMPGDIGSADLASLRVSGDRQPFTNTLANALGGNANGSIDWGCSGTGCNINEALNTFFILAASGTFSNPSQGVATLSQDVNSTSAPIAAFNPNAFYSIVSILGAVSNAASTAYFANGVTILLGSTGVAVGGVGSTLAAVDVTPANAVNFNVATGKLNDYPIVPQTIANNLEAKLGGLLNQGAVVNSAVTLGYRVDMA